jgi:hypothetical protein
VGEKSQEAPKPEDERKPNEKAKRKDDLKPKEGVKPKEKAKQKQEGKPKEKTEANTAMSPRLDPKLHATETGLSGRLFEKGKINI